MRVSSKRMEAAAVKKAEEEEKKTRTTEERARVEAAPLCTSPPLGTMQSQRMRRVAGAAAAAVRAADVVKAPRHQRGCRIRTLRCLASGQAVKRQLLLSLMPLEWLPARRATTQILRHGASPSFRWLPTAVQDRASARALAGPASGGCSPVPVGAAAATSRSQSQLKGGRALATQP